ncbi:hypothetical protein EYF80_031689 [Liparis tanakae]|uniref:Uncharacterized protein n=1 Tax=Liparis tanakae TaxID=230148 RepID=A0A4Z2GXV0_9TELE|nr:hypothetical protein EYF80_031689 [Liparis tanakae]
MRLNTPIQVAAKRINKGNLTSPQFKRGSGSWWRGCAIWPLSTEKRKLSVEKHQMLIDSMNHPSDSPADLVLSRVGSRSLWSSPSPPWMSPARSWRVGEGHLDRDGGGKWGLLALPAPIWQLPIKGGAPRDGCLVLLEDLLALQSFRALSGRAAGQLGSSSRGHPMPTTATLQISTSRLPCLSPAFQAKPKGSTSATMPSKLTWNPSWPRPFRRSVISDVSHPLVAIWNRNQNALTCKTLQKNTTM